MNEDFIKIIRDSLEYNPLMENSNGRRDYLIELILVM